MIMKSLYESILSSTKSGKIHLVDELKNNIKHCKNVSAFARIWGLLGLNVDNYRWEYLPGGGYVYSYNHKYIILCEEIPNLKNYSSIFICDEADHWPDDFDIKEYVNNIAKTLNMSFKYTKTRFYELKFN